ncbi:MAG: hypothetical protein KME23_17720 [Goleter apudmare HA4340-LM2]|jgi:hypothetical protein|nr:hypothetical protein [Goleter apudmare HA4340-LM2]MBW4644800.1 hypothetical protein [Goleter apudmare HA4340-LM2]
MTKPDFQQMTLDELKNYVLAHRDDEEAFQTYITRKRALAVNAIPMTIEEAEADLERRFGQQAS